MAPNVIIGMSFPSHLVDQINIGSFCLIDQPSLLISQTTFSPLVCDEGSQANNKVGACPL